MGTEVPLSGSAWVNVPSFSVDLVSLAVLQTSPASSMAWQMPVSFSEALSSGTVTISTGGVRSANHQTQNIAITATAAAVTPPMIIWRLRRALAASARCSARVLPVCGVTCSNWPVTGLNACVACPSAVGLSATVAASCSACRRAFILVRSVSGLNAAATGTPPFMKVSRSFLNSAAVAYRF